MSSIHNTPLVLCILDGWGVRQDSSDNAITQAHTPHWNSFLQRYPHTTLQASEGFVGLPQGQMGNSEVGHMTIGLGRVIEQDLVRIDKSIQDDTLKQHYKLISFLDKIKKQNGTVHLMGLLSPGGVHSHIVHFEYLAQVVENHGIPAFIHAFLDGRDTPPKSALSYIQQFQNNLMSPRKFIHWGTIMGRYYSMDRDQRWERTKRAYDCIVRREGTKFADPLSYVQSAYNTNITDEFVEPGYHEKYPGISENDGIIIVNFRADRVRQILKSILFESFDVFSRNHSPKVSVLGMTSYSEDLNPLMETLFPPAPCTKSLGEVFESYHLRQLRIAETEKYAHVTFFFNGGREEPFQGETRILIPSPKVSTYDLQPEMSAFDVTNTVVNRLAKNADDIVIMNFANTDMVGHTGNFAATKKAVEVVDECLGTIAQAVLKKNGVFCITADHGNAEMMKDSLSLEPHTAHTCNQVPFVMVSEKLRHYALKHGALQDIAPTLLDLLNLPKPEEILGESLLDNIKKHDSMARNL